MKQTNLSDFGLSEINFTNSLNLSATWSLWVSRVLKYPKKCLKDLTTFIMSTWWGDSKNMVKIEFSRWLFEGRLRQGKNVLPDGLNWLCYLAGSSKSHRENSISFMFFEFSHHEKRCQIIQTLFWAFQYSRNSQWSDTNRGHFFTQLLIVICDTTE